MQPPKIPSEQKRGKPFATSSIVMCAIGALPLLVYLINCIRLTEWDGGSPVLVLAMGFIGFVIHGIGLVCGITAVCMGYKGNGIIGAIGNGVILGLICLLGFLGFAMR